MKKVKQAKAAARPRARRERNPGYKVVPVPAAISNTSKQLPTKLSFSKKGDGRITVSHREYIGEVLGSADFGVDNTIPINPGLGTTFPWLHHMAFQYESYRFKSLKFEYMPNIATNTPGRIYLFLDYDAADAAPVSKQGFLSNHRAVSGNAWSPLTLVSDQEDLHKLPQHTMRYGSLAPNLDIKTYDVANLFVASGGFVAPVVAGELYVDYVVEFITPQLNLLSEVEAVSAKLGSEAATTSKVKPLSDKLTITGGLPVKQLNSTQFTIGEAGDYLANVVATGTALLAPTLVTPSGVTMDTTVTNAASTLLEGLYRIKTRSPGEMVTVADGGSGTLTGLSIRLAPYLYSLG